jgi:hypothetical protein
MRWPAWLITWCCWSRAGVASGPTSRSAGPARSPLALDEDAAVRIDATVLSHDDAYHLTRLGFAAVISR